MPTGIILKSASHEVSDEQREKNLQAVVEAAGYEVAREPVEPPKEPKRDDFKSEEEFEAAHVSWQDDQEKAEKAAAAEREEDDEEERVPETKAAKRRARYVARATAPLQAEIEELKKKLETLSGAAPKTEPKVEEQPKEAQRPKRADYAQGEEGQQKYEDALLAWGVEKATKDKYSKEAENAERARQEKLLTDYGAQLEEAREAHEDWDELQEKFEAEDIFIGQPAQLAILELENGAEVTYYLMRHPTFAAKLGKMSQVSAVMEVGRLAQRLRTGATPSDKNDDEKDVKPRPKVPRPVETVSTRGSNAVLTFAEIAAKPNYPGKARDLRAAQAAER